MARKAPRRTAERILEASLALFNRFGEPHVSTAAIAADLGISSGNLYYHYRAKDEIVNALFAQYEQALGELLQAGGDVADVEDAWFFTHRLFELVWQYRFLYRDLNNLLSRNRQLETQFPALLRATGPERRDAVMAGMTYTRFRKNSIAGPEQFLEELERTRQRKYGLDNEEFEEHVICMSAPIFDHWSSVVAGLSVSFPEFRFDRSRMDEYAQMIVAAGRAVSQDLGCSAYPPDQQ